MVDAQPRSAECRVPIRLHNNSRFGRQRNGGLFGLEPISKSWTRGAADCIDMTSGIAARLGYPGSHWLGPRQHFPSRIQGRFSCRVLSLQFFSMIDGAAPHWCRDPLRSFCATTS